MDLRKAKSLDRFILVVGTAFGVLVLGGSSVGAIGSSSQTRAMTRTSANSNGKNGRWSPVRVLFHGPGSLAAAVSCASTKMCVAVGARGSVGVALAGSQMWSQPVVVDRGGGLAGVSCLPNGSCEAVGASAAIGPEGVTYRRLNGVWTPGVNTKFALAAVSCAGPGFCAGVDNQSPVGHAFTFDGRRWSGPVVLGASTESISCPTVKFCGAISQSGKAVFFRAPVWSKAVTIDSSGTPVSISCPNASLCVVVDANGNVVSYTGHGWSKPKLIDPSASLTGVSCASSRFCVAVDSAGASLVYSGTHWTSPQVLSANVQFTSISCPNSVFCAAVGQNAASTAAYETTYVPSG